MKYTGFTKKEEKFFSWAGAATHLKCPEAMKSVPLTLWWPSFLLTFMMSNHMLEFNSEMYLFNDLEMPVSTWRADAVILCIFAPLWSFRDW